VLDRDSFSKASKTSIDCAVMERTQRAAVLAVDVGWSDVGQWSTVWRLSPQDAAGNSLRGRAVAIDSSNVLVRSDERLTAVIGLENVIVIATGDSVLVAHESRTDKVKQLVERLKAEQHPEATRHRRCTVPGAITRASTRVPAIRSSASSFAPAGACRCRSIFTAPNIGSSYAARRR
jgi:mannose-1-phosphate guanylyltransferase/mannose-6-phosphate isomerase